MLTERYSFFKTIDFLDVCQFEIKIQFHNFDLTKKQKPYKKMAA